MTTKTTLNYRNWCCKAFPTCRFLWFGWCGQIINWSSTFLWFPKWWCLEHWPKTLQMKKNWINQINFCKYLAHINLYINLIYSNSCSHAISGNNCACIESNTIFLLFRCLVVDAGPCCCYCYATIINSTWKICWSIKNVLHITFKCSKFYYYAYHNCILSCRTWDDAYNSDVNSFRFWQQDWKLYSKPNSNKMNAIYNQNFLSYLKIA